MNRRLPTLLALLLALSSWPLAEAGPLREALRARRERMQEAARQPAAETADGLDAADGPSAKFALPPGSRLEKDIAYGSDPAQRLDLYLPADAKGAPLFMMVHGGAWMLGDKAHSGVVANKAAHWLPKGYAFASVNYRMSKPTDPLEQAEDVGKALAFVQANAQRWGIDPARVMLVGHSSGAHLVGLLAADPSLAARQGAKPWLGTVLLDSAALDVVQTMERNHPRFYDRVFGNDRARWAAASPFQRLSGAPAPLLLVCSSRRSDSCPAAQAFAAKVVSLGGRSKVVPVDLSHGEVNAELGRSSPYTGQVDDFARSLGLP